MEATKEHISLETAKLLKDCGVENSLSWCIEPEGFKERDWYIGKTNDSKYPAFTWQEIEENTELFFGIGSYFFRKTIEFEISKKEAKRMDVPIQGRDSFTDTEYILFLRQQKKYKEADLYFREHCIFIKD
jgi:hypothetical protein